MLKPNRSGWFTMLALLVCMSATSCNKNPEPTQAVQEDPSTDPAQANLAQASQYQQSGASAQSAPVQREQRAYAPEPANQAPAGGPVDQNYDQDYEAGTEQSDIGEPVLAAAEPPPPIPQYSQPECPGENYLWTPGNWSYASNGYYWVPGVWVVAPYIGALWTPPYWAFGGGRYHWHHGYWGQHIGYYGGINYGFGYVGRGYEGGYWNREHFAYNRSVNNVNVRVVQNVYNYRVTNVTNVRVSYVGGRGGLNVRPTAAELAVLREPRIAPLPAQVQQMRQAEGNRAQFVSNQKERPETLVLARPLATEYKAPAPHPSEVRGARSIAPVAATRVASPAQPQRMEPPSETRPGERPRPAERVMPAAPVVPGRQPMPNEHRQPQAAPAVRAPAVEPTRPELAPRSNAPVHAPAPESHPAPPNRTEQRPMPQPRMQERSVPEPQMREKTAPAPRVEPRSEPQRAPEPKVERPAVKPAPEPHPKPEEKKPGEHEHHF
jgi:hypothetical protein